MINYIQWVENQVVRRTIYFCILVVGMTTNAEDYITNYSRTLSLTPTNFIEFIRKPPAVDTLVYRRVLFEKPRYFKSKKEAEKYIEEYKVGKISDNNKSEELFALRYLSPENFIFQQIDALTNVWSKTTRLKTFAGRDEGLWWNLTFNGVISTDSTNGIYKQFGQDNTTFTIIYQFATEIFHLGMFELNLDTIQEMEPVTTNGDVHFTGRSFHGESIDGTAKTVDGMITQINYRIIDAGGPIQGRIIEVSHKHGALHSIQVSSIVKDQHDPLLYCLYEILNVVTPSSSISRYSCGVNQFLTASDREILVKKNGDMFTVNSNTLSPVIEQNTFHGYISPRSKKPVVILIIATTLVVPLVRMFINYRRMAKMNQNK